MKLETQFIQQKTNGGPLCIRPGDYRIEQDEDSVLLEFTPGSFSKALNLNTLIKLELTTIHFPKL